ncbi:MAG: DUF5009 domain-containing protein [Bacteroidales bacterium]|nr:DUF5009 domain-containing protein [Bacteroidales bacterium]
MDGKRLLSIDVLRGFDMMFIMGFASIVSATCMLFPGGEDCWLDMQMSHVAWDGLRHHDTIFPLFLFISGMTFPFSLASSRAKGASEGRIFRKTVVRGLILFLLGLVYNGIFKLSPMFRIPSVLARIGLAWMFAAWIYMACGWKWRAVIAAAILIGYNLLLLIPAPDAAGAGSLTMEGNIVGYVDRVLMPGHLYKPGLFDPEGLLSTLPAIVTAMLGQFTGEFVKDSACRRKTLWMFAAAAGLLVAGLVWSLWLPVNKSLWTSSFVLVVGAYSLGLFALFHWIIDVKGWKKWTPFFTVIGMNSITIYMLQRIVSFKGITAFFLGGAAGLMPKPWGSWLLAIGYFAVCWLLLWFLYRKKVFLKV